MTPDKANALREAAERATPGPWRVPSMEENGLGDMRHVFATGLDGFEYVLANCKVSGTFVTSASRETDRANAAYIALADPPTMKDLLAERERLRGALKEAAKRMDHCRRHIESGQVVDKDVHGALCRGRDAARQALEATDDR